MVDEVAYKVGKLLLDGNRFKGVPYCPKCGARTYPVEGGDGEFVSFHLALTAIRRALLEAGVVKKEAKKK